MKDISQKIRQLREEAGLSATQLALRSELSLAYISKLENGEYDGLAVRLKTAKALAEGLGLSIKSFMEKIGFLPFDEARPSFNLIKNALRSDGLSDTQADEVVRYVQYIKNPPRGNEK